MRDLLLDASPSLQWSNASYMHLTQLLWDALGRAARHHRIGHKGDEATYTVGSSAGERGGDMGAYVDFDVIEMNTLYYICGYAIRCVMKWKPALVERATVTGSHEALVFSAMYGNREILSQAWFARKLVALQVCDCVWLAMRRSPAHAAARRFRRRYDVLHAGRLLHVGDDARRSARVCRAAGVYRRRVKAAAHRVGAGISCAVHAGSSRLWRGVLRR
jgi:hypothetical protein